MDLEAYVDLFTSLHRKTIQGVKAPHKPILLLAVIHLIEKEIITENSIRLDNTLKSTFKQIWEKLEPQTHGLYSPDIVAPMWRMHKELFWHLNAQTEFRSSIRNLKKEIIEIEEYDYNRYVDYVELDADLFFLLSLDFARDRLKEVLLNTYLNKTLEQYKTLDETIQINETPSLSDSELEIENIEQEDDEDTVIVGDSFSQIPYDIQLLFSIAYYTFLKDNKDERKLFSKLFPTIPVFYKKVNENLVFATEITNSFKEVYLSMLKKLAWKIGQEEDSELLVSSINKVIKYLNTVERFTPILSNKQEAAVSKVTDDINNLPKDRIIEIREERKNSEIEPEASIHSINDDKKLNPVVDSTDDKNFIDECTIINASNHIKISNKNNIIIYNSTGYAIRCNDDIYRIHKTYNLLSINHIVLCPDKTFETGNRIVFANEKSALYKVLKDSDSYQGIEIRIDDNQAYVIIYKGFSYGANGDVVRYIPKSRESEDRQNITSVSSVESQESITECNSDSFVPKGNIACIPTYINDSYDLFWIVAIVELLHLCPIERTFSHREIGLMMISCARDFLNRYPCIAEREVGLSRCIMYAIRELRNKGITDAESVSKEVFYSYLKSMKDKRIDEATQILTNDAQFNILKAWFQNMAQQEIYIRSLHFGKSCLYSINPRKEDPYIEINPGWRGYMKKEYLNLCNYFESNYLNREGVSSDSKNEEQDTN